jgi:hypothetical protein
VSFALDRSAGPFDSRILDIIYNVIVNDSG